ncbi:MAG: PEP/pyruvate-binding domain-containing protein, partial [Myxococcota bacterium]
KRVHFMNSSRFELHFSFVSETIDSSLDHSRFNARQYRSPDREYICASVVHYLDGDHYALEFVPGDSLDAARIERVYSAVAERTFFGERLGYRPLSPMHEDRVGEFGPGVRILRDATLMATLRYQATVPGVAYGFLRIERGPFDASSVSPNEILVTAQIPDDLPLSMGLITGRLQAPLAHVAVLSRNRGTPDMALRDATEDPRIRGLEGQLVRLEVGPQDFSIARAERSAAEADWARRRPRRGFVPAFRLGPRDLVSLCNLDLSDVDHAGAKASQLGAVCGLDGVETPGGFVVPFARYDEHLQQSGADARLARALRDERFRAHASVRAERLAAVRSAIEDAPVDDALVRAIHARIRRGPNRRWIFRSSTNAEDLPGFNGAGLYRSAVVGLAPSREDIADALRRVWSSVWLQRAHEERDWFRIDGAAVKMAVLIQPFVDAVASGVAITRNPFDEGRPAYYVNVQTRAEGVTSAQGDELPESLLIYTWTPTFEVHTLGLSTRSPEPILRQADAEHLASILEVLHERLAPTYGEHANAVDVEFLMRPNRSLVIVQARPIRIDYTTGQGWRTP